MHSDELTDMSSSMAGYLWPDGPGSPILGEGDLHLWLADLDCPPEKASSISAYLSDDELARAARMKLDSVKKQFLIRRSLLRKLLGRYLHASPELIEFCAGPYGKPRLSDCHLNLQIEFNLSSSSSMVLFAFRLTQPIGIDMEWLDPDFDYQGVVSSYFSAEELAELQSLEPIQRRSGFYRLWVRKEAYLKGLGTGFSQPDPPQGLAPLYAGYLSDASPSFASVNPQQWLIYDLVLPAGYLGALAVIGPFRTVYCWKYPI